MNNNYKIWFVVGTQHLYGEQIFKIIEKNTKEIVETIKKKISTIADIELKAVLKTSDEIEQVFKEANYDDQVIGLISWTHTFSPSKMWIRGLNKLQKPILQLDTQFNKEIPWSSIDMDFMNLNQSAHGDREHGYIFTRMRKNRKVVTGYFKNEEVLDAIENWVRSSIGYQESSKLNIIRFGDNMRNVAVTEGDKVEAQIKLGWSINTVAVTDLKKEVDNVTETELKNKMKEYEKEYIIKTKNIDSVNYQAKLEIAMDKILKQYNASAYSNTFEDLGELRQLPGLASQNLMKNGVGYAGEGDWKTAGLVRIIKQMAKGKTLGSAFMEDYTYHLTEGSELILGSHMLEVDPSISSEKPRIEVHPLSIGGKEDPARLIFNAKAGKAMQVSLVDMGNRFRLIVQDVNCIKPLKDMPNLPVARAMWSLEPNFKIGGEAWMLAGGAHHTVLTYDLNPEVLSDFAEMLDIEYVYINEKTTLEALKEKLRINQVYYR